MNNLQKAIKAVKQQQTKQKCKDEKCNFEGNEKELKNHNCEYRYMCPQCDTDLRITGFETYEQAEITYEWK